MHFPVSGFRILAPLKLPVVIVWGWWVERSAVHAVCVYFERLAASDGGGGLRSVGWKATAVCPSNVNSLVTHYIPWQLNGPG